MQVVKDWLPALAGMFFLGLGAGLIGVYGFFVGPLSEEFGVGVAVLNLGPVALLLVPGLVSPAVGSLVDRVPIRRLILVGVSVAMGSLLLISVSSTLWLAGLLFLCFVFGLVFYGPVVINGLLVKQYPGREARALAIAAIGISVASATLPPLTGYLLVQVDWRSALAALAAGLLVILWLVALLFIPAGVAGVAAAADDTPSKGMYRERAFWLIGWCMALGLNVTVILAICYPPHFIAQGYTPEQAGWFLALSGLAGFCGKMLVAWLGDRVHGGAKWLAAGILLLQAVGIVLLLGAGERGGVLAAMAVLGFSSGAFLPLHAFLNSRYFGAAVIGRVTGAQMPLFLPLGVIGAPLAGYVFDRTGSYQLVLTTLAAILCLAALLALRLAAPRR